jgi:hypothetical protein
MGGSWAPPPRCVFISVGEAGAQGCLVCRQAAGFIPQRRRTPALLGLRSSCRHVQTHPARGATPRVRHHACRRPAPRTGRCFPVHAPASIFSFSVRVSGALGGPSCAISPEFRADLARLPCGVTWEGLDKRCIFEKSRTAHEGSRHCRRHGVGAARWRHGAPVPASPGTPAAPRAKHTDNIITVGSGIQAREAVCTGLGRSKCNTVWYVMSPCGHHGKCRRRGPHARRVQQ